jgi:hypothetical protein
VHSLSIAMRSVSRNPLGRRRWEAVPPLITGPSTQGLPESPRRREKGATLSKKELIERTAEEVEVPKSKA